MKSNFQRVSYAIACLGFSGDHDYKNMGSTLYKIFEKLDIPVTNISVWKTDNGSNLKKTFSKFGLNNFSSYIVADHNCESGFDSNLESDVEFDSIADADCNYPDNEMPDDVTCYPAIPNALCESYAKFISYNTGDLEKIAKQKMLFGSQMKQTLEVLGNLE